MPTPRPPAPAPTPPAIPAGPGARAWGRDQAGVTVMEVMIAIVLTSILLLGMNELWQVAFRQLDQSTLRQKAVFRLNAEMERVAAWYVMGTGTISTDTNSEGYGVMALPTSLYFQRTEEARRVWMTGDDAAVVNDVATFVAPVAEGPAADADRATRYAQVLVTDTGTTNSRNLVWLDLDRRLLARVSWFVGAEVTDTDNNPTDCLGYETNRCRELTLYLDYPFRYSGDTQNPLAAMEGVPLDTLTLKTIIGRRKQ